MKVIKPKFARLLKNKAFPRSSKYDPKWVMENDMGPDALWLTEWLCRAMDLKPDMRLLDMGCGKGLSSVFLAREFGVQVWANDLWIGASDNWKRIRDAGVEKRVFPIHAEAHALPYAEEFFDAVVSLDSYHYYGTDDLYLQYFSRFVKPGGQIGIVVPGLMRDLEDGKAPKHLTRPQASGKCFWDPAECFSFHTVDWWRRLWGQTELVKIETADTQPDGWRDWLQFEKAKLIAHFGHGDEVPTLEADQGRYLGFVRLVARRQQAREVTA